jgi:PPOX class probable F420-dependent enzyme
VQHNVAFQGFNTGSPVQRREASPVTTEDLWKIVAGTRNGILATIGEDGVPQLSNIYYLCDPASETIRFSTTTLRMKGRNLLRHPRATLHVPGRDFFNFAVVTGTTSSHVARGPEDAGVEKLFEIHSALGATSTREGFGDEMVALHRMAVELHVQHIYGQILDR